MFVKVSVEFPKKMWLSPASREELSKLLPDDPPLIAKSKAAAQGASRKGKGGGVPVVARKSTLRSFGDYGRPRRGSSSSSGGQFDENFGSFFFR
jgi:hypothetical protein